MTRRGHLSPVGTTAAAGIHPPAEMTATPPLPELLASVPPDPSSAPDALAVAASQCVHDAVSVAAADDGGTWAVLAGPEVLADGSPIVSDGELCGGRRVLTVSDPGGAIMLVLHQATVVPPRARRLLQQGCTWLSLIRGQFAARERAEAAVAETTVLQAVIGQLLTVRDLDQVLLSIADRTLHLLDADICGVLLREGSELRMRACVGHRVVETARLRMRRGHGVAGLVMLTGKPAKVDDYLQDQTITQDFMSLAVQEQTQSALAVPLRLHGEFLGVLEVWRRRPSLFTDHDVRRMVTLADVATIAIDNARLYDDQTTAVSQLKEARDALEAQVAVLQRSSALQQRLLAAVLDGSELAGIARTAARELDCPVGIYGSDGRVLAYHPGNVIPAVLPESLRPAGRPGRSTVRLGDGSSAVMWLHPVFADGDKAGCVCLIPGDDEAAETLKVVGGQIAMACSLALLRQNAASRARAEALDQVLWDLVQGPDEHRIAARSRAEQMGVTLAGPHRVLYGQLDNLTDLATELGWDTSQTDRARRKILRTLQQQNTYPGLRLSSMRGDWLVAIAGDLDARAVRKLVNDLAAAGRQLWPRLRMTWGVSQRHEDAFELPRAFGEAKIALSAAHRLGNENVFLYEELGIVRLLLGSGKDPDLRMFIQEITGPLVEYDRRNNGALIRTLRAFFDADCSQKLAADRLFIHHKTLRYRIRRIEELTGLDLCRHDDRMRADMALRLLQVTGTTDDLTAGTSA